MKIALITGSAGLVGSEAVSFFADKFDRIIGIDNNYREVLFGANASIEWNLKRIQSLYQNYAHYSIDIRDKKSLEGLYKEFSTDIELIVHTAAQPSHDWAAKDPFTDFSINANGTLNLLEMTRLHCPEAVFIFTSTNTLIRTFMNKVAISRNA